MTLTELIKEVYVITGRPDLVEATAAAVRKATLKLHSVDYFYRDLEEVIVGFPVEAYKQQYDLAVNLPDFRSVKYVRHWTQLANTHNKYLDQIDPSAVFNEYGREASNVWYVAGSMLNIKSTGSISNLVIGYYKRPNVSTNLFTSWIANEEPYYIIEEAAYNIFQMIGQQEAKVTYQVMSAANVLLLKQNYLTPLAS